MKLHLGLMGRLAMSLITIAVLSQYLNYKSFDDLLKAALHQRESEKSETVSKGIGPYIRHDAELVRSVSVLLQHELSTAMQLKGEARTSSLTAILDHALSHSGVDVLEVTDEQGIILYRAHDPKRSGDLSTTWGIDDALSGTGNLVSKKTGNALFILYIEPIRVTNQVIGTVSSGKKIDDSFIKTMGSDLGANLALVDREGTVLAANNRGIANPDPAAITEAFQNKTTSYRTNEGARTSVSYLPLLVIDDAWVIMTEIDSTSAFDLLKKINDKAAIFSLFVIISAILITLVILRFMLRPLRDLRRRAETMVADLTDTQPSRTPCDDINSLVTTLDTLTTTLLDRNRKLTEQQTELLISAAAFDAQLGMVITDAGMVALRANKAYTEITGKSVDETIGRIPAIFRPEAHSSSFNREFLDTLMCTGKWQGELSGQRKNGETYPEWLTVTAVKNNDEQVTHYIITCSDISERRKAEKDIEELAFYDPLTHLPNRRLLTDRLSQAITTCKRNRIFGALLFINLDHFKTLNDTLGHTHGDLLLQQTAQRLVASTRTDDTVAHLAGDEFIVILGNLGDTLQQAARQTEFVSEKILKALNYSYHSEGLDHHSSASIGATLFGVRESTADDLLRQAGLAMHQAKNNGRNSLRFFDPAMQTLVVERAYLENSLREALTKKQFALHYQAQIDSTGQVTGAEALLRWQHPERGLVSPASFIPLAEESGLILPLGRWVIETACSQLARWSFQPEMKHLTIAVNVSTRQFRHPDFVSEVLMLLAASHADPRRLKLELTESMLAENVEDIVEKMLILQRRGVSFSLDDFGTGYSSLSYLKRLPLAQLKIDQSFVRDVLIDPNDAAIAKTIVALGQSLGLQVIAEGVETLEQKDFLKSTGCHAYQGYYFCRPLPLEEYEAFVLGHQDTGLSA